MCPDRATIAASTPSCPVAAKLNDGSYGAACGKPLTWDHAHDVWRCPVHRKVLTPEQLVARQTPTAA